jgi:hypothetical protein
MRLFWADNIVLGYGMVQLGGFTFRTLKKLFLTIDLRTYRSLKPYLPYETGITATDCVAVIV